MRRRESSMRYDGFVMSFSMNFMNFIAGVMGVCDTWYMMWAGHDTQDKLRERKKEEESISRFDKRLGKNSVCRLFIGFTRERSERMQRAAHRWKRPSTALAFASFTLRSEYSTAESLVCRVPRITFEGIYCAVGNAAASTLLVVWLVFSPRLWNIRRI